MSNNGIEQFLHAMPQEAREDISRLGVESVSIGDGVSQIMMAGHDRGVAYRFFMHPVYNKTKSDELGYEVFEEKELIEWTIDRKNRPNEYVEFLPQALLQKNRDGDVIGGRYKDAYLAWKSGKSAPGTSLRKWGLMSDAMVASLEADGLFTVEQFSELDRSRVTSKYPQEFIDAYDRAGQFLAAQQVKASTGEMAERLKKVEEEKAELLERLSRLEAAVEKKAEAPKPTFNLETRK